MNPRCTLNQIIESPQGWGGTGWTRHEHPQYPALQVQARKRRLYCRTFNILIEVVLVYRCERAVTSCLYIMDPELIQRCRQAV